MYVAYSYTRNMFLISPVFNLYWPNRRQCLVKYNSSQEKGKNAVPCRCRHEHLKMKITLATAAILGFKGQIINVKKSQNVVGKT